MSMSQEEIESLMNGLDIAEDSASEVASEGDALEDTIVAEPAPVEEVISEEPAPVEEPASPEPVSNDEVDELLASIEDNAPEPDASEGSIDDLINNLEKEVESSTEQADSSDSAVSTDDIDELLASIDNVEESSSVSDVDSSDIDELLSSIDGVEEEKPAEVAPSAPEVESNARYDVEDQIQKGVFPLPADQESKVVSQLSAVANDSEEKASKIFDVLSYILDENSAIDGSVKKLEEFMEAQENVLQTLNAKFPNVDVFSTNLELLNSLKDEPKAIRDRLNNENNELFSAMELMQYHDINRQKIERVMSVIRKLTIYLNNIFEDDNSHEEIVVAKHIAGDSTNDLVGDEDLDALIAEFGN